METQAINCGNETEYLEVLVSRGVGAVQSLHGLGYRLGELGFLLPTGPKDFSFKSDETNSGALTTSYSVANGSPLVYLTKKYFFFPAKFRWRPDGLDRLFVKHA